MIVVTCCLRLNGRFRAPTTRLLYGSYLTSHNALRIRNLRCKKRNFSGQQTKEEQEVIVKIEANPKIQIPRFGRCLLVVLAYLQAGKPQRETVPKSNNVARIFSKFDSRHSLNKKSTEC